MQRPKFKIWTNSDVGAGEAVGYGYAFEDALAVVAEELKERGYDLGSSFEVWEKGSITNATMMRIIEFEISGVVEIEID